MIRLDQYKHFDAEFDYFESGYSRYNIKDIPENVQRFNLYKDEDGLLRVKSNSVVLIVKSFILYFYLKIVP